MPVVQYVQIRAEYLLDPYIALDSLLVRDST